SKTVNVPEDYPYGEFQDLYFHAWKSGLKGLATYRPNKILGSVLSVGAAPQDFVHDDVNRRISVKSVPAPVLASLRWPGRPDLSAGNPAWTYMVEHPHYRFAVFVGHVENGMPHPFEVWVNGSEQPRGLGALAKSLSMDMRANDQAWLKLKLDALAKTRGDDAFEMPFPPRGEKKQMPSIVSAFAQIVRWRVEQLHAGMGDEQFKLLDFPQPLGDFMAFVPGSRKQQTYPSTVAYLARLIVHRYAMLGILNEEGLPRTEMGILETPSTKASTVLAGAPCPECGNSTL